MSNFFCTKRHGLLLALFIFFASYVYADVTLYSGPVRPIHLSESNPEAFKQLQEKARAGDLQARYDMSHKYRNTHDRLSFELWQWMNELSEKNYLDSQERYLNYLNLNNQLTLAEADYYWRKFKNPVAAYYLGNIYEYGSNDTVKNEKKSQQYYLFAAKKNYTPAMLKLAQQFEVTSMKDAVYWYEKAARNNDNVAIMTITLFAYDGLVPKEKMNITTEYYQDLLQLNKDNAQLQEIVDKLGTQNKLSPNAYRLLVSDAKVHGSAYAAKAMGDIYTAPFPEMYYRDALQFYKEAIDLGYKPAEEAYRNLCVRYYPPSKHELECGIQDR